MRLDLCVYTAAEALAGASILFAGEQLRHSVSEDWFASMGFIIEDLRSIVDRVKELYRLTRVKWFKAFCAVDFLDESS